MEIHKYEIVGADGEATGLRYIKESNANSECADLNKWGVPEFMPYEVRTVPVKIQFHRALSTSAVENPLYADLGEHTANVGRHIYDGVIRWSVTHRGTRLVAASGTGAWFHICAAEAAAKLGQIEGVEVASFGVDAS